MEPLHLGPLAVWHHVPEGRAIARVCLVHGICEHSERHANTIKEFLDHRLEVVRFDLRGAGRSGGRRQYVERFEDYVTDVARVFNWVHRELPPLPLFLLGHSLGGAVATHFAALYGNELTGLILSAPAYRVGAGISPIKILLGRIVHRLNPTLRIKDYSDNHGISRDPDVVRAYREDALTCHFNTVQQGTETLRALAEMPSRITKIATPTLITHGTHDLIIRIEGSFELLQRLPAGDRSMHVVPGGFHELHNDYGKEEYLSTITRWITMRASACNVGDHAPKKRRSKQSR